MAKFIKLDSQNTKPFDKIKNGDAIGKELQADPNVEVKGTGNELRTAAAELQGAEKAQTDIEKEAIDATAKAVKAAKNYDEKHELAANKIEEIYPDNPDKYVEKKFRLKAGATESSEPSPVTGLGVTLGDKSGEADLNWNKIDDENIQWYNIAINSADPGVESGWQPAKPAISKPSKITLPGLTPGTLYWFRVSAHNDAGDGGPSNVDHIIIN